jgi:hypothetical protein
LKLREVGSPSQSQEESHYEFVGFDLKRVEKLEWSDAEREFLSQEYLTVVVVQLIPWTSSMSERTVVGPKSETAEPLHLLDVKQTSNQTNHSIFDLRRS